MKLREFVPRLIIDPKKLTEYALNPLHPRGQHKARVLAATLGYTRENYEGLLDQIEANALDGEVVPLGEDFYGKRVFVDLEVTGTANQKAIVRTGWLIVSNSQEARLTTLYVRKEGV
jgi:hypothetical protein